MQEFRILHEVPLAINPIKYYIGGFLVVCYEGDQWRDPGGYGIDITNYFFV